MASFLPYVIVAGVMLIFFAVCYILFSGDGNGKENEKKSQPPHAEKIRPKRSVRVAPEEIVHTAPVPKLSGVTVKERQENPAETAFVTTKGEVVRRSGGEIVYEEARRPAEEKYEEVADRTCVLSREELVKAMEQSGKAAEEKDGREKTAEDITLTDMAAVVAADLAEKSSPEKGAPRRIVQEVMEETAKAAARQHGDVSDETQVISPAELRKMQDERPALPDKTQFVSKPLHDDGESAGEEINVAPASRQGKSPWGNDAKAKAVPLNRSSIWSTLPDADSPVVRQCTAHFLSQYGMVTADMKKRAERITVAAFQRIDCRNDSERKKALEPLIVQEALQNVQKAYAAHPKDYVAALALQAFADIAKGSPVSTRHLIAVDALKVMPYLSDGHYNILSILLLFLYSRNSHNVDKKSFEQYIHKYVIPFLDDFPTEQPYYQQLDYLHCTAIENKETRFAEILADSYPLLFRYRGITEEELRKALKGQVMPAAFVVPSFNSPLVKLAIIDENMATRFFRLAGVSDRAVQANILRLAKKRPADFSGEEALDIMEDISPVLADVSDIWDSTMLRVSTLSLLGLYLAQGYVKEQIGEEFDVSRWFS